jgi:hypothetical protein
MDENVSTRFSQEPEVGVTCRVTRGWRASQARTAGARGWRGCRPPRAVAGRDGRWRPTGGSRRSDVPGSGAGPAAPVRSALGPSAAASRPRSTTAFPGGCRASPTTSRISSSSSGSVENVRAPDRQGRTPKRCQIREMVTCEMGAPPAAGAVVSSCENQCGARYRAGVSSSTVRAPRPPVPARPWSAPVAATPGDQPPGPRPFAPERP